MKEAPRSITIDFASTDHRLLARSFAALAVISVVLTIIAGALVLQARAYRAQYLAAEKGLAALAESMAKNKPALEERQRLTQNLGAMNALLDARDFSWVKLLSALEQAFPSGVALSGLSFNAKDHLVDLEGKAGSPEALSGLMIGLEKSVFFRSPQLKRQSLDKGIIEFHVAVIYHNAPAGGRHQELSRTGR
ncbi:MAG: PilN domain-containing protein [Nitrospirota bacterium]|nr:PilN domain-containing protein [Nitrospirota bacterium]